MSSNSQSESTADGPPPSSGGARKICFSIEGKEPATVPYSKSDVSGGYLSGGARRTSSDHDYMEAQLIASSSSQAGERDNSGASRGVEDACDGRTPADDRDQREPRRNDLADELISLLRNKDLHYLKGILATVDFPSMSELYRKGAALLKSQQNKDEREERDGSRASGGLEEACDGRNLANNRDQWEPCHHDLADELVSLLGNTNLDQLKDILATTDSPSMSGLYQKGAALLESQHSKDEHKENMHEPEEKMDEFHPLQEFFNCHFLDHVYLQEMLTDLDKLSSYAIRGDSILNQAIVDHLMGLGFQPQYALRHITNQFYAEFVVNNKLDRFLSHVMSDKEKHDVEIFKKKIMKNKNELSMSPKEDGVEEKEDQHKRANGKLSKGGDEVGVSNKRKNAVPNFLKILADLVEGMAGLISQKVSPAMAVACVLPKLDIAGRPDDNTETNLRFLMKESTSYRINVKGNKKSRDNVKADIWISETGTRRTVMIKGSVLNIQKWLQLFLWKLQKVEKGTIAKLIVPRANISEEGKIVKRPSSVFCDKESKQLIRSDESEDWDSIVEINGSPSEQETQILSYLKVLMRDQQYQRIPLRTSYRGPHN